MRITREVLMCSSSIIDLIIPIRHVAELKEHLHRAEALARVFSHDYIGVEHVFLTLRDLPTSHPVAAILAKFPIDVAAFWQELEQRAKVTTGRPVPRAMPYTPRLQFILRSAAKVAKARGKRHVTLYHFVAAVALEHTSLVAQVFRRHLRLKGNLLTHEDASAQLWSILMAFPDILMFIADGTPNLALESTSQSTALGR